MKFYNYLHNTKGEYTVKTDVDLVKNYNVHYDFNTKIFTSNARVCFNNVLIKHLYIFFSEDNCIIFTNGRHFGYGGYWAQAAGVLFLDTGEFIIGGPASDGHRSRSKQLISALNTLQMYALKYKNLFEDYINNTTYPKQVVLCHQPAHIGHDILDGVFNWGYMLEHKINTIKVLGNCLFFTKHQLSVIFEKVDIFSNEEELFVDTCINKNMLYTMRHTPIKLDLSFIKKLTQPTVGLFLKEDGIHRNCLNSFEFYTEIIHAAIKCNINIKIFGYIRLYNKTDGKIDSVYVHSIEKCNDVGNKLLNLHNKILFFNNISIEDFIEQASTLDYYITLPGSIQHIVHLFASNLKTGIVYGDHYVNLFKSCKKLMQHLSLPTSFLEYYDCDDNNLITNTTQIGAQDYNIKIKNLNEVEQYFINVFSQK